MPQTARQRWFAQMLQAGLEEKLLGPIQILSFVTPEILAHHLPPEVMSRLLATSLSHGAMTPERLLEVLPPKELVEHVPLSVLWTCIVAGAERAGIASPEKSA